MRPRADRRSVAVAGALGATAAWCWPAAAPVVPWLARLARVPRALPHARGIALTFDDGPHPAGTAAVLELLAAARATATFFLVGEQVERFGDVAASIVAAGHEIGLHGYRHRLLLRVPNRVLADDLARGLDAIGTATGRLPDVYRPPYGVFSAGGLALVRELGLRPLLWSRWGRDWGRRARPEAIARRASAGLGAGDVVLLHDADHYSAPASWRRTAAALPSIIDAVVALGEPFVAVSHST